MGLYVSMRTVEGARRRSVQGDGGADELAKGLLGAPPSTRDEWSRRRGRRKRNKAPVEAEQAMPSFYKFQATESKLKRPSLLPLHLPPSPK